MGLDRAAWRGRRVLVTGHTGFKGAWLSLWLSRLGCEVAGIALDPVHPEAAWPSLAPGLDVVSHRIDIRDAERVREVVAGTSPEVVFHLAAQALVRASYEDPVETIEVNVTGTANILAAVAACEDTRACVVVTSDKVYRNDDSGRPFVETDPLGGADPYSASKACTELVVGAWRTMDPATRYATARAGNVIGGGDAGADRLLPDIHSSVATGGAVVVRNPGATRPWQFVLEPVYGYLLLAQALAAGEPAPAAVNFGPAPHRSVTVAEVVDLALAAWGGGQWTTDESSSDKREARALSLDPSLARAELGWRTVLAVEDAIAWTVEWWRAETREARAAVAERQLASYLGLVGE